MGKRLESAGFEPLCVALLLCDYVHIDPITARRSILGTIHEIGTSSLPVVYPGMYVYAALVDGRGEISITARIVDADEDNEPVWESNIEVEFTDPHTIEELEFEAADVEFGEEGRYRLQLFAGNDIIMERSVVVKLMDDVEE